MRTNKVKNTIDDAEGTCVNFIPYWQNFYVVKFITFNLISQKINYNYD